ncbi:MAG: hypothetical protein JRN20_11700 [Nitrososphaerota archaeon]|nr:hypothetical protein [Nitrososphaerota archaeon]MDG6923220.1 hypothetical protein [Nitrososphaerota archaeon]
MAVSTKTLYGVIAVLIAIVIIVSSVGVVYYVKYDSESSNNSVYLSQLDQLGVKYTPSILINYGNGTATWYNDTALAPGSNLYTATVLATDGSVNATCCEFGSHFVTGIGGVQNTATQYWWVWTYDPANITSPWQTAQTGPDEIAIQNSAAYAWTFCGSTSSGNPMCTP